MLSWQEISSNDSIPMEKPAECCGPNSFKPLAKTLILETKPMESIKPNSSIRIRKKKLIT